MVASSNMVAEPFDGVASGAVLDRRPASYSHDSTCRRSHRHGRMISPTRQLPSTLAPGGTLARASTRAGLFLTSSRSSPRAPCSVRLTRDARSPREGAATGVGANRAICMRRRGIPEVSRRSCSIALDEAAHDLRTHDADRHHPGMPGGKAGAAGIVMRSPLRPSIPSEVNNFTHARNSSGSSSRKREPNKERFACVQNLVAR